MRKIFLIISICMLVLITSSCSKSSDSAKPATETVSYTVNDICGDYIDIISTKSLEVTEETMFFTNETKTSRVSEAWSIEGDEIILSDSSFKIKQENDYILLVNSESEYVPVEKYADKLPQLSIGQTAKTDCAEFTLKKLNYAKKVDASSLTEKTVGGGLVPPTGMVFAHLTYDVKNTSKEKFDIVDDILIAIDYDNGFKFATYGDSSCAFRAIDGPGCFNGTANGAGRGYSVTLNSLTSNTFIAVIPCAEVLKDDTQSPLSVIVTLPTKKGFKDFAFKIR